MRAIGKASICCLLLAIAAGIYFNQLNSKLVGVTLQVENGKIKGVKATSRGGRVFHEFLGIPYAEPPVGELRFEPPRPYNRRWSDSDDPYDATYYRKPCAQLSLITAMQLGVEDCLYLNVFSPTLNSRYPLPVLVHFYGGLFMEGQSNIYGPKYFMDEDVVLVTLNYRVGALGFLNTGDGAVVGNMGLKDQNLALRWVQTNIVAFGGDPNRVTIFGQSAGSAAVHYHMLSPKSAGLFHKAISQSGVALNPWAFNPTPAQQARRFASMLNCSTPTPTKSGAGAAIAACLRSKDVSEIIEAHREVLDATRDPISVFVPSAELDSTHAFLTQDPFETMRSVSYTYPSRVPWLSGLVADEGLIATSLLFRNETLWHMDDDAWARLAPRALYYTQHGQVQSITVTKRIRAHYLTAAAASDNKSPRDERLLRNLTALFTDRHFHKGIHDAALHYARAQVHAPVYLYYYAYPSQFSLTDILLAVRGRWYGLLPPIVEIAVSFAWILLQRALWGTEPTRYGVCHADEVHMFFNVGPHDAIGIGHVDYEISRRMVRTWVQFAGAKSEKELDFDFDGVAWPHVDVTKGDGVRYMQIGAGGGTSTTTTTTGQPVETPNGQRLEFWNSLGLPNG